MTLRKVQQKRGRLSRRQQPICPKTQAALVLWLTLCLSVPPFFRLVREFEINSMSDFSGNTSRANEVLTYTSPPLTNEVIDEAFPSLTNEEVLNKTSPPLVFEPVPRLPVIQKPETFPNVTEITEIMQRSEHDKTAAHYMLDIAIVGFPKCGTSTMMKWLSDQAEISIPDRDVATLKNSMPWDLVKLLYRTTGTDSKLLRGYKNQVDIWDPRPISLLGEFFPQTKLIIGIRHPVRMIESLYNSRVESQLPIKRFDNLGYHDVPGKSFGVHWSTAEYHVALAGLGKTSLETLEERQLFPDWKRAKFPSPYDDAKPPSSTNPVFIYDTRQLADSNTTRLYRFQKELANFLGLALPLNPPPLTQPLMTRPAGNAPKEKIESKRLDICDESHRHKRQLLLNYGSKTKTWILDYFIRSPSVYVANGEHFYDLVGDYALDPCIKERERNKNG